MLGAIQAPVLYPALFVSITFLDGPVYVWTGVGTVTWNGFNFIGVGSFGSISLIEEGTSVEARGITLGLSGIDNSLLAGALQNMDQELPVTVWLGLFDGFGNLIPDPVIIWSGQTDQPRISFGPETATIEMACESRLLEMNVASDFRYTFDTQQNLYPGDTSMSWINGVAEFNINWGQQATTGSNV
jgi:hypothetical protein